VSRTTSIQPERMDLEGGWYAVGGVGGCGHGRTNHTIGVASHAPAPRTATTRGRLGRSLVLVGEVSERPPTDAHRLGHSERLRGSQSDATAMLRLVVVTDVSLERSLELKASRQLR
jgi:hypothetical protein